MKGTKQKCVGSNIMTREERNPVWSIDDVFHTVHNKNDTYCLCADRSMTTMYINNTEEEVCSGYWSEQDEWSTLSFSSPDEDLLCDDEDDTENNDDESEKNDDDQKDDDSIVFDTMISRLTPLPNKWCSRTGTFVFEIIEPVIETVPVDNMKKQWEVVPSVAVAISDIIGEQEEEERILEQEREKRRQIDEAARLKNRRYNEGRRPHRQFDRSSQHSSKHFENEPRRRPCLLMNMKSSVHDVVQKDVHGFKTVAPERSPPVGNQRQQNRVDILCAFPKVHSRTCSFVHSLMEWKPRECKYEKTCSRGDACMYWHKKREDKKQYLERALTHDVSSFKKYKDHYMSTYIKKK